MGVCKQVCKHLCKLQNCKFSDLDIKDEMNWYFNVH